MRRSDPTGTVEVVTESQATHGIIDGSFDQGFWFDIPVPLRSKSNFRRSTQHRGQWSELRAHEDLLAILARTARPEDWELGEREGRLGERPQVVVFIWARSTLDSANFSKSLLDALEGTVFWSDASVRYVASLGQRARNDQRAVACIARLSPSAEAQDLLLAARELEGFWCDQLQERPPSHVI